MERPRTSTISSLLMHFLLFLLLPSYIRSTAAAHGQDGCSLSSCGNIDVISYPFRLRGVDPSECGDPSYELVCESNRTMLYLTPADKYYVIEISYLNYWIRLVDVNLASGNCTLPRKSFFIDLLSNNYILLSDSWATFMNCPKGLHVRNYEDREVPCLSRNDTTVYVSDRIGANSYGSLPPFCHFIAWVPTEFVYIFRSQQGISQQDMFPILQMGFQLQWIKRRPISQAEIICKCFGQMTWSTSSFLDCLKYSYHKEFTWWWFAVVLTTLVVVVKYTAVFVILGRHIFAPISILLFLAYKFWETHVPTDTVEKFLRNQESLSPTRYSYPDIVIMTNNFKEELGNGGFGSVFKGILSGPQLVAVKMLRGNSKFNGEDFINEVSTIGRIHHVNIVRLVGFCSEGTKRALIYEYMANGSLDKYIFSSNGRNRYFTMEKLNDIAVAVAKGIDYLH